MGASFGKVGGGGPCVKDVNLQRPRARGTVCPGLLAEPAIAVSFRRYRAAREERVRENGPL